MKKIHAIFDWFFLVMSPVIAAAIWLTDSVGFLRFLGVLWLIGAILEAIRDRLEARLTLAQGEG